LNSKGDYFLNIFTEEYPSLESYFRSVILFGKNSASYKFALAKSLLDLSESHNKDTFIPLDDLSIPFSKYICEHLKINDKQTTSSSSRFLNVCRDFNNGTISHDDLILSTKKLGFENVLDAFHNLNQQSIPVSFFEVKKDGRNKGITLTDDIFHLIQSTQHQNFNHEVEARWRLVETAWSLNISPSLLNVYFDDDSKMFFINEDNNLKRIDVTSSRDALNGYQKGKCFYCFNDISVDMGSEALADVDHFLPFILQKELSNYLNGVWNLVLSCKECNRGKEGKFAKIPEFRYLERLHKRNEFFIESHHPLNETLKNQTGKTLAARISFLNKTYNDCLSLSGNIKWQPLYEHEPAF